MFDGHAQLTGAAEHGAHIHGKGLASQQQPSRRVPQNAHIRVFDGADHASRHLLAALFETRMHAGDHHIHLRQHLVVHVQRAIGQDVHLDAGEDADAAFHAPVHFLNVLDVLQGALFIQAAGHGQDLRVVGDGNVLVAHSQGSLGHFED